MGEQGIMSGRSAITIDVRDMVCAQALAIVAQAVERLPAGGLATILYNAPDVRQDLLLWARDRGCSIDEQTSGALHLQPHTNTFGAGVQRP